MGGAQANLGRMAEPMAEAMQQAIANVPSEQLSARHTRIAAALSLIQTQGYSINKAAKTARVPYSTLCRYHHGISKVGDDCAKQTENAIVHASAEMAMIATERITDRLLDDDHEWKDADLVKVQTAGVQAVALKRQWSKPNQDGDAKQGISALAQLLQGADVTLTKRKPDADAIDVTPEPDSEPGE